MLPAWQTSSHPLGSSVSVAPGWVRVADLTGHPYLPADRATADAMAALPGIREAVYDAALDDPADVAARPVAELARWAQQADAARDQTRYAVAAHDLGTLLTELHIAAATGPGDDRRAALGALVQACHVAGAVAEAMGNQDLALACAAREHEVASRLGDPTLLGLARYGWAQTWARVGRPAPRRCDRGRVAGRAGLRRPVGR